MARVKSSKPYKPRGITLSRLTRAWEVVEGLPYRVSLRFVFYVLWQEGFYSTYETKVNGKKKAYDASFNPMMTQVRMRNYRGWRPWTVVDDTRDYDDKGGGFQTAGDWLDYLGENGVGCSLDVWKGSKRFADIWFEARAMMGQFKYYAPGFTLIPMAGQPSVSFKYRLAQRIEDITTRYNIPFTILYFGDSDDGGQRIVDTLLHDIHYLTDVDFEFVYCGLTPEQAGRYGIQPIGDGFQWEALPDIAAREIITDAVQDYTPNNRKDEEREAEEWLAGELKGIAGDYHGRINKENNNE